MHRIKCRQCVWKVITWRKQREQYAPIACKMCPGAGTHLTGTASTA
jgi:hypothetical protein